MIKKVMVVMFIMLFACGTAMATPPGQNKDGAGFYEHSVTGNIKYFDSHPGEPSQWEFIGEDYPNETPDCPGGCDEYGYFDGSIEQQNGALSFDGDVKEKKGTYTVEDGALAIGSNKSSGEYFGKYEGDGWGVGGALTLGATGLYTKDTKKTALAAGVTGNISAAGVGGSDNLYGCAYIEGEGTLTTIAIKEGKLGNAYGVTNGDFSYSGRTANNGVVIGGGVTGGVSVAHVGGHHAGAVAGGMTVSGVGNINVGGSPQ